MASIQDKILKAEKFIRMTARRRQILAILLESEKALSAYEIIDAMRSKHQLTIQAMSIYRILDIFQQKNLVHKIQLLNKYIACSHMNCGQEHRLSHFLICINCALVKETQASDVFVNNLKTTIKRTGYFFMNPQLEISCLCKKCIKNQ